MKNLLISVSITFTLIFGGAFIIYNYVPLDWITVSNNTGDLGAITTLVGTENLSDFPTTYNANLAQLMRMSTTSIDSIATLSNLVTVGTITGGVWSATTITVSKGGTGATSLTDNAVLVGSGTSALTALSVGTNGQLLIGSTSADPVFATLNCDRSLTCTTGAGTLEIDIDSEIFTRSATANIHSTSSNVLATSTNVWLSKQFPQSATITSIDCYAQDLGTSTIQAEIRTSALSAGSDILYETGLNCGADEEIASTTLQNVSVSANDWITISVPDAEPTGARPRIVLFSITWTYND